ncbi:MAG: FkbM family methyltransferase [Bacteroidia bacterium]
MRLLAEISFRGFYYFLTDKYYRQFIGLVFRYGDRKRHQAFQTKILGYHWVVADALSFIWQYKEIFADQSYRFKTENDHPVIIDCGGNIGLSCLYYHCFYPNAKVYCYEPDPQVGEILRKNLEGLENSGLTFIPKAVWTMSGELSFYQHDVDSGSLVHSENSNEVRVSCVDLREEIEKHNQVDFLKMDVEGAETELIPHIAPLFDRIRNLFIEYHSFPGQAQKLGEMLALLQEAGFRYYLKTENRRKTPLSNKHANRSMDYQTNIYAYRP